MFCFTGRQFLLDDIFYLTVCIIGGHVQVFFNGIHVYKRAYFTGGYVLEELMY